LCVYGLNNLYALKLEQYPKNMHFMALASSLFLFSLGICEKDFEPNTLKCLNAGLKPYKA